MGQYAYAAEVLRMAEEREATIASLRELADALENTPMISLPTPRVCAYQYLGADPTPDAVDVEPLLTVSHVRSAMRHIPGGWSKSQAESATEYVKTFTGRLKWTFRVCRSTTCEQVQVGTRIVPAVPEHEEPVYEWRCDGTPDAI